MIKILLNLISIIIIFLTCISIPQTDEGSSSLNSSFIGSPKKTANALKLIISFLILFFLILSIVYVKQTL